MDPICYSRTHDIPGCTGSWRLEALENLWLWRCAECRAVDFGSLGNLPAESYLPGQPVLQTELHP